MSKSEKYFNIGLLLLVLSCIIPIALFFLSVKNLYILFSIIIIGGLISCYFLGYGYANR